MNFTPLEIPGLVLIEPRVFNDTRGFFLESYSRRVLAKNGIKTDFVQDNHCVSAKGVLRGLHYQARPKAQAKLVRVARGSIYDVALDIRPASKTFGRWCAVTLTAAQGAMLYIPEGFAHGYLALEPETHVFYKVSDYYSPAHEKGILWNDPEFGVRWPQAGEIKLSEKDRAFGPWPSLRKPLSKRAGR